MNLILIKKGFCNISLLNRTLLQTSYICTLCFRQNTVMPKKVLIVGAGAAGTAAAYSFGKQPEKFNVEIWERGAVPGMFAFLLHCKGYSMLFMYMMLPSQLSNQITSLYSL